MPNYPPPKGGTLLTLRAGQITTQRAGAHPLTSTVGSTMENHVASTRGGEEILIPATWTVLPRQMVGLSSDGGRARPRQRLPARLDVLHCQGSRAANLISQLSPVRSRTPHRDPFRCPPAALRVVTRRSSSTACNCNRASPSSETTGSSAFRQTELYRSPKGLAV